MKLMKFSQLSKGLILSLSLLLFSFNSVNAAFSVVGPSSGHVGSRCTKDTDCNKDKEAQSCSPVSFICIDLDYPDGMPCTGDVDCRGTNQTCDLSACQMVDGEKRGSCSSKPNQYVSSCEEPKNTSNPTKFSSGSPDYSTTAPDLGDMVEIFFNWSLSILGIVVFISFFWSGIQWGTAYGNPSKVSQAQERMRQTIFGAILLVSSYVILNVINPDFVGQKTQLPPLKSINNSSSSSIPDKTENPSAPNSSTKGVGSNCAAPPDCPTPLQCSPSKICVGETSKPGDACVENVDCSNGQTCTGPKTTVGGRELSTCKLP
jgi:hypothetical protein